MPEVQTPVEKLPQHKGRPVPWVARWSDEAPTGPAQIGIRADGSCAVYYEDGVENREDNGVLWIREGIRRGGTPEYSQVSAYRQRASMRHRLCQVCGSKIETPVIRWLLDPRQINTSRAGVTRTISPPTCDACIPLALELCPALKKDHAIAKVLEYEITGVWSTVVRVVDGEAQQTNEVMVDYDRTDYPFAFTQVIARQQVVTWTKFVMET